MTSSIPHRLRTRRAVFTARVVLLVTIAVATVFFVVRYSSSSASSSVVSDTIKPETGDRYGRLEMSFERNEGQTDPRVKFLARGRGYDLFLTPAEVVLTLRNSSVLRLSMVGANRALSVEGEDELSGKVNYLNTAAERLIGHAASAALGKSLAEIAYLADPKLNRPLPQSVMDLVQAGGGGIVCVSPAPNGIAQGSLTVLIGGFGAARVGDLSMHGTPIGPGPGCPTVIIGG